MAGDRRYGAMIDELPSNGNDPQLASEDRCPPALPLTVA